MTNSNSIHQQECITQDSIQMQSELSRQMNSSCEIGSLGKYVVTMSLADLKEIANGELRAYSEELEHENGTLQYKLDKAIEALKFYAGQEHYLDHCRDYSEYDNADWIEGNVENGQKAREALEEIKDDEPQ